MPLIALGLLLALPLRAGTRGAERTGTLLPPGRQLRVAVASAAAGDPTATDRKPQFSRGLPASADFFPIAVWLQDPRNAGRYRAIGINLYIGLWRGPTAGQLEELARHDMRVICSQNDFARSHLDEEITRIIAGWMHGDEPDNAQSLGRGKGYGPPVDPARIVRDYEKIRAADPTRPVVLNLGQGVAWDGWYGRGVRTNHPEDYERYVKGCDIASFDIYPVVHDRPAVAGKLWYVPRGVQRLQKWSGPDKPVWNCIECTHIGNRKLGPTPEQVRAEVWMSIIHGSRGLIYFCHQFQPRFVEAALLADEKMARAVGAINRQIHELAPALNSPTLPDAVTVETEPAAVSPELAKKLGPRAVATLVKKHGGAFHVFAVRMEDSPASATFHVRDARAKSTVTVLGEERTIEARDGAFTDAFGPHAVHIYRVEAAGKSGGSGKDP